MLSLRAESIDGGVTACHVSGTASLTPSISRGKKEWRLTPSKAAFREATAFEPAVGAAGAEIVSPELFFQQLVAVNNPHATFDVPFGRKSFPSFAHDLKRRPVLLRFGRVAWGTSLSGNGQSTSETAQGFARLVAANADCRPRGPTLEFGRKDPKCDAL
jgi:hypothetical protein